jgi:flavin-dependent dehydrogenase
MSSPTSADVVIVGARCAGAATAMLLARAGLRALVVERGQYGADALSTHALMRAGVIQLHRWGVLSALRDAGTPAVRSAAFHYGDEVIEIPVKPQDGVDGLYGPRRTVIDRVLVDAARASGAEVLFETKLIDLIRGDDGAACGVRIASRTGDETTVTAGLVIGADGLHSTVAQLVGAEAYRTGQHATGVIFNYWRDVGIDAYHWYFSLGGAAGVIPTNDNCACVFVSMPQAQLREALRDGPAAGHRRLLRDCKPDLAAQLEGVEPTERYRAFGGHVGHFRQSFGPGWALVGDAGYFKDPLTAHGITDALMDAELVARAAIDGSRDAFAAYQVARDAHATTLFEVSDQIASFDWDLTTIRQLHRTLSEELKKETALVSAPSPA